MFPFFFRFYGKRSWEQPRHRIRGSCSVDEVRKTRRRDAAGRAVAAEERGAKLSVLRAENGGAKKRWIAHPGENAQCIRVFKGIRPPPITQRAWASDGTGEGQGLEVDRTSGANTELISYIPLKRRNRPRALRNRVEKG